MKFRLMTLVPGFLICAATLSAQDTWYGSVSGMQLMYNPAFAGVGETGSLNISAYSFLPGKGFGLRSVHASYDSYFNGLHGGAGIWLSDDMLGEVMNDLRGGVSYAYHFRAGRNVYITSGMTASAISRGIRTGSIILPGDIDPLRGITGEGIDYTAPSGLTRFDLGMGFTIASGPWYGGFSAMHLTRPHLSADNLNGSRIDRLYALTGGAVLTPKGEDLSVLPSAALIVQGDEIKIYLGSEASWKGLLAGLAVWHVSGGFIAAGGSLGWDASNVKIIMSYSYIVSGGNASIGGTAIVKAGAAFSFGNVEKSRATHIIKLPLL